MQYAVVADHDPDRARILCDLLNRHFSIESRHFEVWEQLRYGAKDDDEWILIVIAFDLWGASRQPSKELVGRLHGLLHCSRQIGPDSSIIVLFDNDRNALIEQVRRIDRRVRPLITPNRVISDKSKNELRQLINDLLNVASLPQIELPWDDRLMRYQLRLIDPSGDRDAIEAVLTRVLRKFRPSCQRAVFRRINQGRSGSVVLRATVQSGTDIEKWVLKLSPKADFWKVHRPHAAWREIAGALNGTGLTLSTPQVVHAASPDGSYDTLVSDYGVYAEAWQLLGEESGHFADFEEVYHSAEAIAVKHRDSLNASGLFAGAEPLEVAFLKKACRLLGDAWYGSAEVQIRQLWDGADAAYPGFSMTLPYQLTDWWKTQILVALLQLDRLGSNLCRETWAVDADLTRTWVERGPPEGSYCAMATPVLISPIHGDLNRNNLLLFIDQGRPFLIDFATYQARGHALDDLAHLEAEIKYSLMDSDQQLPIGIADHCLESFVKWRKVEDCLSAFAEPEGQCPPEHRTLVKKNPGIGRAMRLVGMLRLQASGLRREGIQWENRLRWAYASALLYHTLRRIAYGDSVPPLKRVYAVYSASRIIRFLSENAAALPAASKGLA